MGGVAAITLDIPAVTCNHMRTQLPPILLLNSLQLLVEPLFLVITQITGVMWETIQMAVQAVYSHAYSAAKLAEGRQHAHYQNEGISRHMLTKEITTR